MLTNNFAVRPDPNGNPTQRCAVAILALDPKARVPNDIREARALLDALERKQVPQRQSGNGMRLTQFHEVWNAMLPQLNKAKRLGISRDAISPKIPENGIVTPDDLQVLTEYSHKVDEDIVAFESQTPDQRRIAKLEADLATAYGKLVRAHNEQEARIAALEAIIAGGQAAA